MNKVKVNASKFYFWWIATMGFILPLVSGSPTNEAFEFPKTYFIYIVGGALIAIFFVQLFASERPLPKIPLYIQLYLLSFIVSTAFSMHLYTSLWGYYTRFNGGLISIAIYFGIYLVAKTKLSKGDFANLFKVLVFSIVPVSILGILDHSTVVRVTSTFGQPNWLAQYLGIFLIYANLLFFEDSFAPVWFVISIIGFTCLWYTYSLSGILGFMTGFLVLTVLFKGTIFKDKANILKLTLLVTFYLGIALLNLGVFKLRMVDVTNDIKRISLLSPVSYAAETTVVEQDTPTQRNLSDPGFIRSGMWLGTLKLIFSSPKIALIGAGPETFPYAFQKFRPAELNYSSEWNFVLNKPHNYFLEVPSQQGLFGLAIYLYLYWRLLKGLEKKYKAGFIVFAVTNFFGWPTASTTLLFWLLLASLEMRDPVENNYDKNINKIN